MVFFFLLFLSVFLFALAFALAFAFAFAFLKRKKLETKIRLKRNEKYFIVKLSNLEVRIVTYIAPISPAQDSFGSIFL